MHFPHNIIIQYTAFRDSTKSSTVNYTILYDEQKEILEKLDIRNILPIEKSFSNLLLKLDVNIYDISIETIILGILNNLFSKNSSIDNNNILTTNNTIVDDTYTTKELSLNDLMFSFHQFITNKGHFARDMKKISKQWEIALNKNYLCFSEESIQDDDITVLQDNRIRNNNNEIDLYKHFAVQEYIYNSIYSLETQYSDNYYFIFYRVGKTNTFYKFIMYKGTDYNNFQRVEQKYNYIKIDFNEAIDRCNLFEELERNTLETLTKEQLEAIISNFVLINGGQKRIKEYISDLMLPVCEQYDWDMRLKIATLTANKSDSSCAIKCSNFCPFYKNCVPINDSMIETMKNRKPIEAKQPNIEYTEFYEAREQLKKIIEKVVI